MSGIVSSFFAGMPGAKERGVVRSNVDAPAPVGIFENHEDVGTVLHAGSIKFDDAKHTYTVSGSGNNMWAREDDFQFAWKKMSGDVSLAADISILGQSGNPHKKAVLIDSPESRWGFGLCGHRAARQRLDSAAISR